MIWRLGLLVFGLIFMFASVNNSKALCKYAQKAFREVGQDQELTILHILENFCREKQV